MTYPPTRLWVVSFDAIDFADEPRQSIGARSRWHLQLLSYAHGNQKKLHLINRGQLQTSTAANRTRWTRSFSPC